MHSLIVIPVSIHCSYSLLDAHSYHLLSQSTEQCMLSEWSVSFSRAILAFGWQSFYCNKAVSSAKQAF